MAIPTSQICYAYISRTQITRGAHIKFCLKVRYWAPFLNGPPYLPYLTPPSPPPQPAPPLRWGALPQLGVLPQLGALPQLAGGPTSAMGPYISCGALLHLGGPISAGGRWVGGGSYLVVKCERITGNIYTRTNVDFWEEDVHFIYSVRTVLCLRLKEVSTTKLTTQKLSSCITP